MESSANYGIQQSGGTSNVGNQAVGPNARATSYGQRISPATGDLLAELTVLLDRHRGELPGTADTAAEQLHDELAKPQPDRGVLTRILDQLATVVKPIVPLVKIVAELTKAINSAFHG